MPVPQGRLDGLRTAQREFECTITRADRSQTEVALHDSLSAARLRQFSAGRFHVRFLRDVVGGAGTHRIASWAAFLAVCASVCLLVVTLGSTFAEAALSRSKVLPEAIQAQQEPISTLFLVGIVLTLVSFGFGGWVRSHKLGIATTCVALIGVIAVIWVMRPFIHRT